MAEQPGCKSKSDSSASSLLGKRVDSPVDFTGSPVKRGRYRSHAGPSLSCQPSGAAAPPPPPTWDSDPGRQALFESYLGWLTASQGWTLSWTENPVWIDFCEKFVDQKAKNPSRRVLTTRILPKKSSHTGTRSRRNALGSRPRFNVMGSPLRTSTTWSRS
ncbi:hypothetical protein C8T65DRAFT_783499, partial [Cerioporus squamosus]